MSEFNYKGFSTELLKIELDTVGSQIEELRIREREIMLEMGRLATERELHDKR